MMLRSALFTAALALAAPAPLWLHTADISLSIDAATGNILHLNTSAGLALSALGEALAGEHSAAPLASNVSVSPCAAPSGARAVCVSASWLVTGQLSNGSCCAPYALDVQQTFWAVEGLPGVPASIGWTT